MSTQKRQASRLALMSFALGLFALVVLALFGLSARIPTLGHLFNNLGLLGPLSAAFFLVVGALSTIFGIAAVVAIIRRRRSGLAQAIIGIVLGLFEVFVGLAALALANLQLNIGPF